MCEQTFWRKNCILGGPIQEGRLREKILTGKMKFFRGGSLLVNESIQISKLTIGRAVNLVLPWIRQTTDACKCKKKKKQKATFNVLDSTYVAFSCSGHRGGYICSDIK